MNGWRDASPTSHGLPEHLRQVGAWARGFAGRAWAHPVSRLAILGLVVRLVLAPFTSWSGDMAFNYWTVLDMLAGHGPYHSMNYTYPPAWAYTLAAPFLALGSLVPPAGFGRFVPSLVPVGTVSIMVLPIVTSPWFNVVAKAPLIVGDLAVGLVIYEIVRGLRGVPMARRAFALWFLNPLVILVGSVNGQFDVLPTLFLLAGAYFLGKRSYAYSGATIAVAVAYKLFAAYLIPAYVLFLAFRPRAEPNSAWRDRPLVRFAAGLGGTGGVLLVFFPWDSGIEALFRRVTTPSYGGFTVLTFWPQAGGPSPLLPLVLAGVAVVLITLLGAWLLYERSRSARAVDALDFMAFHAVALVLVLATQPLVQPQYLLWLLPYVVVVGTCLGGGARRVALLSAVGVTYFVALAGPLVFFYPGAVWYGPGAVEVINASALRYWGHVGLYAGSTWSMMLADLGFAGLLAFGLESWISLDYLWRTRHDG